MTFGNYLKDVKSQIRETDVETLRKTVEAQKGQAGDGNGAGPILIDGNDYPTAGKTGYDQRLMQLGLKFTF